MSAPTRIVLPGVLPSEHAIGGAWSRAAVREAVAPWRRSLEDALQGEQLPPRLVTKVTLGFTDRRKRSVANWEQVVRRLLADGLDQEVVELTVSLSRRKRAATTIELAPAGGDA